MTHLSPPGPRGETICVVAVCPFSKFVVADALPDKSSQTTTRWLHERITCFFGVPYAVRVDQGTEFRGRFQAYCEGLGVRVMAVYTSHPQANGLVERYNGVIKQGLRKMASLHPTIPWTDHLPTVLAGLRFLPTRLGVPPAWIVFKQEVQGLPDRSGQPVDDARVWDEADVSLQTRLIEEQAAWWYRAQGELQRRLEAGDKSMAEEHSRRVAEGKLVFNLQPGDPVLVREYLPGKMRLKAVGPYKFLRAIKNSGAEVLTNKGRIVRVAMANLKPYRPPVTGERMVVEKPPPSREKSAAMFDSSSEEDWATEPDSEDSSG